MLNVRTWFAGVVVLALAAGYVLYQRGGSDDSPARHADVQLTAAAVTVSPSPTPSPTPRIPSLTLADVFPPRDLSSLDLDPSRLRTVIATGRAARPMFAEVVEPALRQRPDLDVRIVDV